MPKTGSEVGLLFVYQRLPVDLARVVACFLDPTSAAIALQRCWRRQLARCSWCQQLRRRRAMWTYGDTQHACCHCFGPHGRVRWVIWREPDRCAARPCSPCHPCRLRAQLRRQYRRGHFHYRAFFGDLDEEEVGWLPGD